MVRKKILVVDDDKNLRTIVECSLEDDWEVVLCESGQAAISQAAKVKPDIILCDMTMPGMDGKTVLAKLKENPETAAIPLVFMTAKVQEHEVEHYMSLGARGVIVKPFDPMSLSEEIMKFLD